MILTYYISPYKFPVRITAKNFSNTQRKLINFLELIWNDSNALSHILYFDDNSILSLKFSPKTLNAVLTKLKLNYNVKFHLIMSDALFKFILTNLEKRRKIIISKRLIRWLLPYHKFRNGFFITLRAELKKRNYTVKTEGKYIIISKISS